MTYAQAGAALGQAPIPSPQDGWTGATLPATAQYISIGGGPNGTVACISTTSKPGSSQVISTPEGFQLGQSVAALTKIYGSRALLKPPRLDTQGDPGLPYYVVLEASGALVFYANGTTVTGIEGTPNPALSYGCGF